MSNEYKNNNMRRRSLFGPILLIAIGLVFLGNNLGLIPGEGWEMIWRLWPVLLIIAGLDELLRRQSIAWPILLIGAGVFFLLNNFGPRVWISWTQVIQLWPILLIAAGIDIVFKGDSVWHTIVGITLTLVLIGGSVWIVREGFHVAADYTDIREIFSNDVERMDLELSLGAGELILGAGTPENVLIFGNITPERYTDQLSSMGSKISYRLDHTAPGFYPHTARWELSLTEDLIGDLKVNSGAGEVILTLEDLDLDSLDLQQGVGRLIVHLPEMEGERVLIKQAIGIIRVQFPEDLKVAIDAQNGLSKVDFPAGFELEDGYYISPKTSLSTADLVIVVEQAMGYVSFQYAR